MSILTVHKIGSHIQDLVTSGGGVMTGLSMQCGKCKQECTVQVPRGMFTEQDDMPSIMYCPYCGKDGRPNLSGRITDSRPIGGDY